MNAITLTVSKRFEIYLDIIPMFVRGWLLRSNLDPGPIGATLVERVAPAVEVEDCPEAFCPDCNVVVNEINYRLEKSDVNGDWLGQLREMSDGHRRAIRQMETLLADMDREQQSDAR